MGTYIPTSRKRKPSLDEALAEAEKDHFLDCPNADPRARGAAFSLDVILVSLLWTGIHHFCLTMGKYLVPFLPEESLPLDFLASPQTFFLYLSYVLKVSVVYLHFVWALARYGGSPAKLLLGLRALDVRTGSRLPLPRALLREFIGKPLGTAMFGFGILLPFVRPDHKALHDLIAGSVVKRVHGGP